MLPSLSRWFSYWQQPFSAPILPVVRIFALYKNLSFLTLFPPGRFIAFSHLIARKEGKTLCSIEKFFFNGFLSRWNWRSCNRKLMRGGCAKKAAKFLPLFLFAYFLAICAFLPPQAPKRALRILRQRLLALELQCTSSTTRRPQS